MPQQIVELHDFFILFSQFEPPPAQQICVIAPPGSGTGPPAGGAGPQGYQFGEGGI